MTSYRRLFGLGSLGGVRKFAPILASAALLTGAAYAADTPAADATDSTAIKSDAADAGDKPAKPPKKLPPPAGAKPLPGSKTVWVDRQKHKVYVDGAVSLRRGVLEMFACPKGTKEHESVVALDSKAYLIHTALLAVGAKSGTPVKFVEEYIAPTGDVIDVSVEWLDPAGKKHTVNAKEWVRDVKTGKPMTFDWVFAGSGFWKDDQTGRNIYMAEGGDLICVANFSTAMLDVAAESTQANDGLMFEAFTEHVPALGTPIRVVLTPKKAEKAAAATKPAAEKPKADKPE